MKMVPGRGPMNAEIVCIGEAPGRKEEELGLPFIGPSGKLQDTWIRGAGLDPARLRYDNVYPLFPPGGHIEAVPWQELQQWQEDCLARLDDLGTTVKVIVPTGNTALSALLGCTPSQAKITQRRGSIYLWKQQSGRPVKVIPIIHPAAVLREEGERGTEHESQIKKNYEARCRADWCKVARELTCLDPVPPARELRIQPHADSWADMVQMLLASQGPLAYDIETNPAQGKILCISFAADPYWAVSVPWSKAYMAGIRALIESPLPKITQNGHYDNYWLVQEGLYPENWCWDTMAMSCLLWPNEPHSLAYLASILTREPWYKGGDEDSGEKAWTLGDGSEDKWRALLDYNARDSAVTWECWAGLRERLDAKGWLEVYYDQYEALFYPILEVMLHGMSVDETELRAAFAVAQQAAHQALQSAQAAAGVQLFTFDTQVQEACWRVARGEWDGSDPDMAKKLKRAKGDAAKYVAQVEAKGVSTQILASVLYDQMKLPTQRMRRTKAVTTNEAALLKLRARYKDSNKYPQGMALIEGVLQYREQKKQSEFLDPKRVDTDGRFRASYSFRPTTGRLSSSSNPKNTGGNAQNIDRSLRRPFKPDPGCLLLEVDLSQAEARVVYCLTRDPQLIELAHLRPSEFDVHTFMAQQVFGLSMDDFKRDRYLAKRIVHASHYDMHGNKCSEVLLKDGYDMSPRECTRLQEKYHEFAPGLRDWQQRTRMDVLRDRALTNAWGRTVEWPWDHFGDDLYRKAYAWRPQSDIARHLNHVWIRLAAWLYEKGYGSRVNLQLHDALILSVYPEEAYDVMHTLVWFMEVEHLYYGVHLSIPAEIKLGTAWGLGDIGEWKAMPTQEEVAACVKAHSLREG